MLIRKISLVIFARLTVACTLMAVAGCGLVPPADYYPVLPEGAPPTGFPVLPGQTDLPPGPASITQQNPTFIPGTNRDFLWDQVVDVVDDYFRIERERRMQLAGNVVTEGRIDTYAQGGATWLEPHRHDSVGRYNRLESTLQTIQRRALVRVIPTDGGFLVDVAVYKELEDLSPPEHATAGSVTFRNDSSLESNRDRLRVETDEERRWIPQGRDAALEQQILAQLHARLGALPPTVTF